jgi:hypothetical protein
MTATPLATGAAPDATVGTPIENSSVAARASTASAVAAPDAVDQWLSIAPLSAATGAFGVFTGFALYALLWKEQAHVGAFLGILFVVALFAFLMEWLREQLAPPAPGAAHHITMARIVSTLLILAAFELTLSAIHHGLELDNEEKREIAATLLGATLGSQASLDWQVWVIALLWCVMGAAIGGMLAVVAVAVRGASWRSGLSGAAIGALSGPLAAGAYLLVVFAFRGANLLHLMATEPQKFGNLLHTLVSPESASLWHFAYVPLSWLGDEFNRFGLLFPLAVTALAIKLKWWPVLVAICVAFVLLLVAPIVTESTNVFAAAFSALLIWTVPGAVLGAIVPFVLRAAYEPRTWGIISFVAAGLLMLVTAWRLQFSELLSVNGVMVLGAVFGLLIGGYRFYRGAALVEHVPFAALTVATLACVLISGLQYTTAGVMQQFHAALAAPQYLGLDRPWQPKHPQLSDKYYAKSAVDLGLRLRDMHIDKQLSDRLLKAPLNSGKEIVPGATGRNDAAITQLLKQQDFDFDALVPQFAIPKLTATMKEAGDVFDVQQTRLAATMKEARARAGFAPEPGTARSSATEGEVQPASAVPDAGDTESGLNVVDIIRGMPVALDLLQRASREAAASLAALDIALPAAQKLPLQDKPKVDVAMLRLVLGSGGGDSTGELNVEIPDVEKAQREHLYKLRDEYVQLLQREHAVLEGWQTKISAARTTYTDMLDRARIVAAQRLEIVLAGALAFWVSLGVIAGGARAGVSTFRDDHGAPEHSPA